MALTPSLLTPVIPAAPPALRVTVVICTYHRPDPLARCLQAAGRLDYPNYTLCVVDNAAPTEQTRALAARHGADYLVAPVRGLSRARNVGLRHATGDLVAYLDDDMIPAVGWLRALAAEFGDERVMVATGPVLPLDLAGADPAAQSAAIAGSTLGARRFQLDRSSPHWFERANFGGAGDGNMAFRRRVFSVFPGFDERLGRGVKITSGEEHYAFFSVLRLGHRLAYAPDAPVFHPVTPPTPEYRQRLRAEALAYCGFLIRNEPRHAWRVVKFLAEGLLRRPRPWRTPDRGSPTRPPLYRRFSNRPPLPKGTAHPPHSKSLRYPLQTRRTDPNSESRHPQPHRRSQRSLARIKR